MVFKLVFRLSIPKEQQNMLKLLGHVGQHFRIIFYYLLLHLLLFLFNYPTCSTYFTIRAKGVDIV